MRHTIRRSYLVRKVETYTIEANADPYHAIAEHFGDFDNDLMMFGELVSEEVEIIEHDELKLEVIDRESAQVIPFRQREETP